MALGSNQVKILGAFKAAQDAGDGGIDMASLAEACGEQKQWNGRIISTFTGSVRRLVRGGLVSHTGPFPRYAYWITGAGLAALRAWEAKQ